MAIVEEIVETPEEQKNIEELKKKGNNHFANGEYELAKETYQNALDLCAEDEEKSGELRSLLLSNMAAVFIKQEQWEPAVEMATRAIDAGCPNEKPLERRAFALSKQEDKLQQAIDDYTELQKRFPERRHYAVKLAEVQERLNVKNEELKKEMMNKLKGLGDMVLRPFGMSTDSFQLTPNESGGYSINLKSNQGSTGQ